MFPSQINYKISIIYLSREKYSIIEIFLVFVISVCLEFSVWQTALQHWQYSSCQCPSVLKQAVSVADCKTEGRSFLFSP